MHLKVSSVKLWQISLGLNVLNHTDLPAKQNFNTTALFQCLTTRENTTSINNNTNTHSISETFFFIYTAVCTALCTRLYSHIQGICPLCTTMKNTICIDGVRTWGQLEGPQLLRISSQYNDSQPRYRGSYCNDKMVMTPSYHYNRSSNTGKNVSLYCDL